MFLHKSELLIGIKVGIESSISVQNTNECLDPQIQKYQHKLIIKQYMCGKWNIIYIQIGNTL